MAFRRQHRKWGISAIAFWGHLITLKVSRFMCKMNGQSFFDNLESNFYLFFNFKTHSPVLTATTPTQRITPVLVSSPYQGYSPMVIQHQQVSPLVQPASAIMYTNQSPAMDGMIPQVRKKKIINNKKLFFFFNQNWNCVLRSSFDL